jgi:hypothetical protein
VDVSGVLAVPVDQAANRARFRFADISAQGPRMNQLRWLRRAARSLLRALQVSRARAARQIIYDFRHLLRG